MAELLLGQPMFPGESGIDQLVEIIKILGTPTRDEIATMNPNYMEHKFPQIKAIPLSRVFKKEDDLTVAFLEHTLQYSPLARATALQCLLHPYFDEIRFSQDEHVREQANNLQLLHFDHDTELAHVQKDQFEEVCGKLNVQ